MSEEETSRLGRDVFIALAAIGWADGNLDENEADAIVRLAVEEGYDLHDIHEIENATKEPVAMDVIDRSEMTKADRLFVYAVASWMTRLDHEVTDDEVQALDELGKRLGVPETPRWHADNIAKEVAEMSEDDRPFRYDLPALRSIIEERLKAAQEARAAAKAAEAETGEEAGEDGAVEGDEGAADDTSSDEASGDSEAEPADDGEDDAS